MTDSLNKNNKTVSRVIKRGLLACFALLFAIFATPLAFADYVGESQTTKFLDLPTQNMIAARYQAGGGGLVVGDEITYIIQFTPVPGGTTEMVGGGAYVTDYIPAGTQVVAADFVQDNGNGTYTSISPPPPAAVRAVFVPQYSETGIFYSTDPRTAMYTNPASNTITPANGYAGPAGGVAPYSIHNAWDAAFNVAAYTTNPATTTTCAAVVAAPVVPSPVAGPDAFIKVDSTLAQGPWHRIAYPGSTIGTAAGVLVANGGCVGGVATSAGWPLSRANPLPANVNAVRFAGGQTTVGQLFSVRITLRITQPVPSTGILNNSEVFGGDVSVLNTGLNASKSNIWRYVFPSVANASSVLIVLKRIVGMCVPVAPATTCVIQPYTGSSLPSAANLNVRYEVTYLNGSGGVQSNVLLTDTMPTGAALVAASPTVISGPNILPATVPVGTSFSFAPLATLGSGAGGTVQYTLAFATAPPTGVALPNTIKMTSASVPAGAISTATATPTSLASLVINKTANTPTVAPGGTASYSISIPNNGLAAASNVVVTDTLPSSGLSAAIADRFAYLLNSVTATLTSALGVVSPLTPITALVTAPTVAPFRETVSFSLPASTVIPSGGTLKINFSATVGSNVPATTTAYLNDAQVSYVGGTTTAGGSTTSITNGVAPVTVSVPMSLAKSVDCIYSGAVCVPYVSGASIPTASKIKYRLTYTNTSGAPIANVLLKDTLPVNTTFVVGSALEVGTAYGIVQPTVAAAVAPNGPVMTFLTLPSLPAGATGVVTYDVQLGTAVLIPSGSYITNSATASSTLYPGGVSTSLTSAVTDVANLVVTKTTTTPTIAVNGVATYNIHVVNTGNVAATGIVVYDYLPFVGAVAAPTTRFNYTATNAFVAPAAPSTLTAPVAVASVGLAANVYPNSKNPNQQQVVWTFTATQALAPGASFDITFTATAGSAGGLPAGPTVYLNDVLVNYTSGLTALTAGVSQTAGVTIPSNLTITKSIDCIYNAAGTVCNAYNGSGIIPAPAVVNGTTKLRYKIHYANTALTAQTNVYICDQISSSTAVPVFAATPILSPVTIIPTPVAPYLNTAAPNGPPAGALANPANALCALPVLAGSVSFSYPVIPSLAAGATGDLYVDVTTNVAASATLTNKAKIVSVQAPAGEIASVAAVAINVPSLVITKTTTTPNLLSNGTASYTISVTNAGSGATTGLKIYDFLPYSGTLVDATKRFTYVTTTGYTKATTAAPTPVAFVPTTPIITPVSAPTVAPYNANPNQQQVLWDFGTIAGNQLQPGDTLTITFTATAGANLPVGNYGNSVGYEFASAGGPGSNNINNQATITLVLPPAISLSKVVAAYSDPINALVNPKFLPGGVAEYSVYASNSGGVADNNTIFIIDNVPANTAFYVKDLGAVGSGPITFVQGTPTSGLTYTFAALGNLTDDVDFSSDAGVTWTAVPVPDANGCATAPFINRIRINPKGVFAGGAAPSPNFTVRFRVCLQ